MKVKNLIESLQRLNEHEQEKEIVVSFLNDDNLEGFPITSFVSAQVDTGKVYLECVAPEQLVECQKKECSYFRHYLVCYDRERNGEKLQHFAFHQAEKRCEAAQSAYIAYFNDIANSDKVIPVYLERQAAFWEKKICA